MGEEEYTVPGDRAFLFVHKPGSSRAHWAGTLEGLFRSLAHGAAVPTFPVLLLASYAFLLPSCASCCPGLASAVDQLQCCSLRRS